MSASLADAPPLIADAPSPTSAGVFGIARTTATGSAVTLAAMPSIEPMRTPAAIDSSRLRSQAFLAEIEEFRRRLDEAEASAVVSSFPDTCDDYFTRARAYLRVIARNPKAVLEALET